MVTTLSRPIRSAIILVIKEDDYIRREMDKTITLVMTNRIGPHSVLLPFTRNTCIAEARETWGDAHKMSGMGGGEKWSKLCNWGGGEGGSTRAPILVGEVYLISSWLK